MPFTYKSKNKEKTSSKNRESTDTSEFDSFFKLAEAARDNDLDKKAIGDLYHKMSRTEKEQMNIEQAEDYINALESIHQSSDGALKVYFQGDREKKSPLLHYQKSGDRVLAPDGGYYRFVPALTRSDYTRTPHDLNQGLSTKSRLNISVKTSQLPLLSKVISDLTLKNEFITQSKVVAPGGIERTAESAVVYFNIATVEYAKKIAKNIQDEMGSDSFLPTTMIGLKELYPGIGYKEFSEGDPTSVALSLAEAIRQAIGFQSNKLKSEKKLRKALKDALEARGYERKNPAFRKR